MNTDRYEFERTRTLKEYRFYSTGHKGRILKIVRFYLLFYSNGNPCYNLVFGDWNEEIKDIEYSPVTNNGDAEKLLATVMAIVLDFTAIFEKTMIYFEGSNMARNRRYQIVINKMWSEIDERFYVYGRIDGQWESFRKRVNYDAFLASRMECIILEEETPHYMKKSKKQAGKTEVRKYNDTFDVDMEYLGNSPMVIQKSEAARKSLEKYGLPKELLDRLNSR